MNPKIRIQVKPNGKTELKSNNLIISRFHEACEKLDASIFEPFINEDDIFEDLGKWEFLQSMKDLFEHVKINLGVHEIIRQQGKCTYCHPEADVTEYLAHSTDIVYFASFF